MGRRERSGTAHLMGVPACAQVVKMVAKGWGTKAEEGGSEETWQATCEEMAGMLNGCMASCISGEKARCYRTEATATAAETIMIKVSQKEWR